MCYYNNNNNNVYLFIQMRKPIEDNVVNGNDSKVYIPLVYASQIVNGTNYVVKVSEYFCLYFFMDFELVNSSLKNKGITCMLPNIN